MATVANPEPELRAAPKQAAIPRVPAARDAVLQTARRPLRRWATVAVVGVEGGAGRTTVTRLLGRVFTSIRSDKLAAVDAVPFWGGLTAAVTGPECSAPWTVHDLAATYWPPPVTKEELLARNFAADGPVPTLTSSRPNQLAWPRPAVIDEAVRRTCATADCTLVDTVADPTSPLVGELIGRAWVTPLWVCTATREGLWAVAEAIRFFERRGALSLTSRSVVAAVAHRRHWPAAAAAAEVQLNGQGLEIIRIPFSHNPLQSRRCIRAGIRLLAAAVVRCCSAQ